MENDRTFAIVVGYHDCSYPPPQAYDAGLTTRFAVVFDNYRRDTADMTFDIELFNRILEAICQAIPHDSLTIEMGEGQRFSSIGDWSAWYSAQSEDERDVPAKIYLFHGGRLAAHAEMEQWALVGGPVPYHDSYTLSFYTAESRAEEFEAICNSISKEICATNVTVHREASIKEPFIPFWKSPLRWSGSRPW